MQFYAKREIKLRRRRCVREGEKQRANEMKEKIM